MFLPKRLKGFAETCHGGPGLGSDLRLRAERPVVRVDRASAAADRVGFVPKRARRPGHGRPDSWS
ncbi:MAG: hypothetical protein MZU84_01720 [Sphingobacterium sp.]|nr:hypothetical protein [Sphingobacterium sp.]